MPHLPLLRVFEMLLTLTHEQLADAVRDYICKHMDLDLSPYSLTCLAGIDPVYFSVNELRVQISRRPE